MKPYKFIISLLFIFLGFTASCLATTKPLPVDQAFRLSAMARDNQTILAIWKIAPGYFLYRQEIHFKILKPNNVQLGPVLKPAGFDKTYPKVGTFEVYNKTVKIPLPIITQQTPTVVLQVSYQGCAENGFCYPPTSKILAVNLAGPYYQTVEPLEIDVASSQAKAQTQPVTPPPSFAENIKQQLMHALDSNNIFLTLLLFFIWGALVSLTPCIYPMIPILSSIIIGQDKPSHGRSFVLSIVYVLGLAITIALVGLIISTLGYNLQTAMQKPWLIISFSVIIIAMALSLFGLFTIQLPEFLRSRLAHASDRQQRGSLTGAFVMGIFSMLIASPCATPPFIFALLVISKSGQIDVGTLGLFFMGIGIGLPLLIIGASSGKILPKSGMWMNVVKHFMGILMLATAIWMLSGVFSANTIMYIWAGLAIGLAIYCGVFKSANTAWQRVRKAAGIALFVYGILLTISAINGQTNPLKPISFNHTPASQTALKFIQVNSLADIQQQLALAHNRGKPALIDFYAKWCKDCLVMDKTTFQNPQVSKRLSTYILMRADVTANSAQNKALEKHFDVIAPPAFIFYNRAHVEIKAARSVGLMSAKQLLQHLTQFQLP